MNRVLSIVYFGDDGARTTSCHRSAALSRLGHSIRVCNPEWWLREQLRGAVWPRLHYRTGYRWLQRKLLDELRANRKSFESSLDVAWVNGGQWFGRDAVRMLRDYADKVVLYNNDDPTGTRDRGRWGSMLKAIPEYDLCVVVRDSNVTEFYQRGARSVLRIGMSYDEIEHSPLQDCNYESQADRPEVVFIGTLMDQRDEFIVALLEQDVPVSIWGDRWERSALWSKLKPAWRGPSIYGNDYVKVIQSAKVCLGMLSKENRDLHTTRSVEIPYIGSVLCAERTAEHSAMFREGEEAVFWSDVNECAALCKVLLSNSVRRDEIARAGRQRVLELKRGNEDACREILAALTSVDTIVDKRVVTNRGAASCQLA